MKPFGLLREERAKQSMVWDTELVEACEGLFDWEIGKAAECAELPEGMEAVDEAVAADPDYETEFRYWVEYVWWEGLWVGIEQSCDEVGLLLPYPQRGERLLTYPSERIEQLRHVFNECPEHVLARVVLYIFTCVRIERARRNGNPHWSPDNGTPWPEERAFFRPPLLKTRNYAR